ncbi:hypothetical protein [Streptomyces sp. UH6]|uniref:hypothetical protein n=1 Tax=Streptomyces sp. UH6 TaxID=2748379 RepID=UPI0015D474E9|nr:hypothetical protein [Streptomyces sp. UH6]NYV73677.1 hypothetical protein [Streptomyces sp. UH6]
MQSNGSTGSEQPAREKRRPRTWSRLARMTGTSVLRGASSAVGGAIVSFGLWWLQSR